MAGTLRPTRHVPVEAPHGFVLQALGKAIGAERPGMCVDGMAFRSQALRAVPGAGLRAARGG